MKDPHDDGWYNAVCSWCGIRWRIGELTLSRRGDKPLHCSKECYHKHRKYDLKHPQ